MTGLWLLTAYVLGRVGAGALLHAGFNPHRTLCGRELGDTKHGFQHFRRARLGLFGPNCRTCDRLLWRRMTALGLPI